MCVRLYKEEDKFIDPLSVTDPYARMNYFNLYTKDNDSIVPDYKYNEELNNWKGTIHNDQLCSQTLKEKRKTEETCTKYAVSSKLNGIPREGKPAIPIKY